MRNLLTQEDITKMEEEITFRKVVERKRLIEDVKEARAHGDLSENFEYKAAKRERGKNESRIRYLERMIKTATLIVDKTHSDEVGLNKQVTVRFLDDQTEETYTIVTTMGVDLLTNSISIESPLGKVLLHKKTNDIVKITSPNGDYEVQIINIQDS